jgi:cyclopropane-fatty-acyl-phospholipid synthase
MSLAGLALRPLVGHLLGRAGVRLDGDAAWDVRVHDDRFFAAVLAGGALGVGESYMAGHWDCERIDELVVRLLRSNVDHLVPDLPKRALLAAARLSNLQSVARAVHVAEAHYDLGNDLFEAMLGPTMVYSCGYFRTATDLDAAQTAKMDLICQKLELEPGDRLLDIGCGFGSLLLHAAERYGCQGVGITLSREQHAYAERRLRGHDARVLLLDYRSDELRRLGAFDKIASVGMFEHVGTTNYRPFMEVARRLLADDGLFLLHTVGNDHSPTDAWINRYIFPNGTLPSTLEITAAAKGLFVLEDWHNMRADYDRTLLAWHDRFERWAASRPDMTRRFYRMWRYYLLAMAGGFRAGDRNQLWQLVLSRRGVQGGYRSIRGSGGVGGGLGPPPS